ncbi:hypothetical protein [Candidatus Vondammii sp. HM_W22]|uniref:hypothetical protein n=1 Tax=Candidatus Vondammii sp. HM_W22 TaxID=2687299 RepID=UPI002A4E1F00|nr:hypothetical protein [Candidatus Vondammii sp. HM_W22]
MLPRTRANEEKGWLGTELAKIYDIFPVLKEKSRQAVGTLSGGQQQMLAIGRALLGRSARCCWMNLPWGWPRCW